MQKITWFSAIMCFHIRHNN